MNLEYMKDSFFEISYNKTFLLFHNIQIFWDAPVYHKHLYKLFCAV